MLLGWMLMMRYLDQTREPSGKSVTRFPKGSSSLKVHDPNPSESVSGRGALCMSTRMTGAAVKTQLTF